ncbi:hypothetical protein IFM89_015806 [Coptis chinensis]|uniref:Uncharacterized protein n=1 Tax=Coptis chinensis TaxID=261450 RepID=A0A835IPH6_9MAGN|nr:hypothetical protein IFM89_015806 [Coptis chinensis]
MEVVLTLLLVCSSLLGSPAFAAELPLDGVLSVASLSIVLSDIVVVSHCSSFCMRWASALVDVDELRVVAREPGSLQKRKAGVDEDRMAKVARLENIMGFESGDRSIGKKASRSEGGSSSRVRSFQMVDLGDDDLNHLAKEKGIAAITVILLATAAARAAKDAYETLFGEANNLAKDYNDLEQKYLALQAKPECRARGAAVLDAPRDAGSFLPYVHCSALVAWGRPGRSHPCYGWERKSCYWGKLSG